MFGSDKALITLQRCDTPCLSYSLQQEVVVAKTTPTVDIRTLKLSSRTSKRHPPVLWEHRGFRES